MLEQDDPLLQDRLYLNQGNGKFKSGSGLPTMRSSTSCVVSHDVDGDGDMDLFVGGRLIPGRYPENPRSYLLINDGTGKFTDQTDRLAPQLIQPGMITDAAWHDLNGDSSKELIIVGEWMPIQVLAS